MFAVLPAAAPAAVPFLLWCSARCFDATGCFAACAAQPLTIALLPFRLLPLLRGPAAAKSTKGKSRGTSMVHVFRRWGRIGDTSGAIGGMKLDVR